MNIAINGFGRIGRNFFRAYLEDQEAQKKITVSAINIGNADKNMIAHLFKYDTLMGTFLGEVRTDNQFFYVNSHKIKLITAMDATKLPWHEENIAWVVDCSGAFTSREKAELHLKSGANHVLISAPAKNEDVSIVPGVNMDTFDAQKHKIVSLGSCTTNALLPLLHVLHQNFSLQNAYMNTVHAYTNSQVLLDVEQKDPRKARAAALNIIPTTTGAVNMVGKIIPDLDQKVDGFALRVPVGKVSFLDLSFTTQKTITRDSIHKAFKESMKNSMRNIIDITDQPLVSSDFFGNNHSVIIDALLTTVTGNIGKIFGWYDNEWGYSVRLKDFLLYAGRQLS